MSDFELLLRERTIREWRDVENISHPFWRAHRESNWLVGRSEMRKKTNSAFIPMTQHP